MLTIERPASFFDASELSQSPYEYALQQSCYEYWVEAAKTLSLYFKGDTLPFGFLKTLGECLVRKQEWAEDLVYDANLQDIEIAALKGERYVRDHISEMQDYD